MSCGVYTRVDVDECRKHFDADVKDIVKVKIVHGFWKRDDDRRTNLMVSSIRRVASTCKYVPSDTI